MHERLLLVRHGIRQWSERWEPLRHGADGNEQTLRYASQWVREDSSDPKLLAFAESLVSNVAADDAAGRVRALFEFVRDRIRYVEDAPGVERIADAWRTIEKREGDCVDKSILLSSLLGCLGYISLFIVQSWDGDLSNGYDHVHVQVLMPDGSSWELDPTNEHAWFGWQAPDRGRASFEIWSPSMQLANSRFQISNYGIDQHAGMGGLFEDFGSDLFQIGAQFVGSSLQQHRLTDAQGQAIGTQFENAAAQIAALYRDIDARLPNITADDYAQALDAYQAIENFVTSHPTEYVTAQWNSSSYKPAAQNYLTKFQRALQSTVSQPLVVSGQLVNGQLVNGATVGTSALSIGGIQISGWTIAAFALALVVLVRKL